jgi:uncharacterized protein YigA (DUF484 family)
MDSERVARYLQENPGFFEQYADLLSDIHIPHPRGGPAIALADRQVLTLRDRNKLLEAKLAELLQFGEENDAIGERMHRLATVLLCAADLDALLGSLYYNLREDFAVPHAALRVWGGRDAALRGATGTDGGARPEFSPVSEDLKRFAASLSQPFCGPGTNGEAAAWFGEAAEHVRSVAFMPLREAGVAGTEGACIGLLALASEDVLRFYPDMGTVYLKRLGELASASLARFL